MPVTALIAGGLGAAGSIGSALIGSSASKSAAQAQAAAQQQALTQQQQLYNQGLGVAQNSLQPFVSAGQSVLPTLQSLLTPGPNQNATLSQTPGFQFQQQYGTMAATNALAAKSGASAGPLATAISNYNQGLAGTTWQNTVNALQGFANTGAGAAGTLGTAALGGSINEGNAQAGTLGNIGTAQAQGILGSANALSGGLSGAAGAGSNALLYNQLLNQNNGGGLYQNSTGNYNGMTDAQQDALQDSGFNLP